MFYDLNIKKPSVSNCDSSLQSIIERHIKFGYSGIAVTTNVDESIFAKSKKDKEKKKKESGNEKSKSPIPLPVDLNDFKTKYPKMRFYNRINIEISDPANIRKFTQLKELKKYDLISFQPESQNVLKALASIAEVDIISYNSENKSSLSLNRKLYNQFVSQNVYFELTYTPAIVDSTARKNTLSLSHLYRAIGKSNNIIVTSGAEVPYHIRGPYDVMNFNLLFGLSEEQSASSISRNCEKVLLKARKNRRSKSTIEMVQTTEESETDKIPIKVDSSEEED